MPWIQLSFLTNKNDSDKAEQVLLDAGALSVTFRDAEDNPILEPGPGETPLWEDIILTGLFDACIDSESLKQKIKSALGNNLALKAEPLEDKDWVRAWMDDYKPMQFGNRLWVCPKHLPIPNPDGVNLMLDPGLAFGTGTHPTTALCLNWLDAHNVNEKQVLDFGCGSGVLAIAALLLGATHCDGVDIDPQAITASLDNAQANKVADKLNLYLPNEFQKNMSAKTYDLVLANILAGPLTELAEQLSAYCKTGGDIVLSGILESQADKIIDAYSSWFTLEPIAVQDEWVRVTGKKSKHKMQTECPHCHTIFRVSNSDLEIANGQVRCGHCLAIFVAENPYNAADYDSNTHTEFPINDLDKENITPSEDEIFQPDIDHTIADIIPPELRAETRKKKSRFGFLGNLLLTLGILMCIAVGFAQYAYYNRTTLIKIPELRPWFEKACALANCTLPEAKDTKLFLLSSKNIFTHPNVDGALMISATIINQAAFAQSFPIIELRFANVRGETIAARRFAASEYLNIPENQVPKIQPDTPVSFTLEIKDPGDEMISYEFDFL